MRYSASSYILPQQNWTGQQIVGLGQNDYHVRSSRSLAVPSRWKSLAIDEHYIWGTITLKNTAGTISIHTTANQATNQNANQNAKQASSTKTNTSNQALNSSTTSTTTNTTATTSNKQQLIQTVIRLRDFHSSCTCVSHHSPCQHALALLFLLDDVNYSGNNIFAKQTQPDWLKKAFAEVSEQRFGTAQDKNVSELLASKHDLMAKGLAELELWLSDLLRSGLNSFKDKPHDYTNAMSHRLIDSDLNHLARNITKLAAIPKQQLSNSVYGTWPELLLSEIGRIYALIQTFKRIDDLPKAVQGDVYAALGWPQLDATSETITDNWYILGKATEQQGKDKEQRTWLYGKASQRLAFITRRFKANIRQDQHLLTGNTFTAELRFYNSQYPLKAEVSSDHTITTTLETAPQLNFTSIAKAHENYRHAKTQNPWLHQFPMLLGNVTPHREQNKVAKSKSQIDSWTIYDQEGYQLPVVRNFKYGWHLMALGLSHQLSFLAEWNGYDLRPISLWQDEHMHDMQSFRGLS